MLQAFIFLRIFMLSFAFITTAPKKNKDHLVKIAYQDGELDSSYAFAKNFDRAAGQLVSHYGESAATTLFGVGARDEKSALDKHAAAVFGVIKHSKAAVIDATDIDNAQELLTFAHALQNAAYVFDTYKSKKSDHKLAKVSFICQDGVAQECQDQSAFYAAVSAAQFSARDLANTPANIANPAYLAKVAKDLAKEYQSVLKVSVLDEKQMQKLGMRAFLAVSQGSDNEGKLVVLEYSGKTTKGKSKAPIALVGKGVTFDTGGISIKPSAGMEEMKFDMGGAAAMLGVVRGLCEAKLPIDVVVVLACAENMPSSKASRPGDVVTAMDGTTIEILNTDAEGRLVLADALCYVQKEYKPSVIIDAATLTGACVVALGAHRSGLYSNDEDVLFELESASKASNDLVWHMPLGDDYAAQIKSKVADLQNIGGPKGGSITAACFLQHFVKDTPWAHLDIAGTAWVAGDTAGATGRPVPLLMHYLKAQA